MEDKKDALVSIIVPIYNNEKSLEMCVDHLANQTYKNIEIVLVDDGSPDNSGKMCDAFANKDSRIKVIHQENGGTCKARNEGIKKSTGKYIMFIDADDYYELNMVEDMVKAIQYHNVDAVRCKTKVYDKNGNYKVEDFRGFENTLFNKKEIIDHLYLFLGSYNSIGCWIWVLIVKREKIVLFDENVAVIDDLEYYSRLLTSIDSLYLLDSVNHNYVYNNNSLTYSKEKLDTKFGYILKTMRITIDNLKNSNVYDRIELEINKKFFNILSSRINLVKEISFDKLYSLIKSIFSDDVAINICNTMGQAKLSYRNTIKLFLIKHKLFRLLTLLFKIR